MQALESDTVVCINAIETRYKTYRFRSRIKARWAVFFDAAAIAWCYEPQGYGIDGQGYLPDFYLPEFDSFFEVKGTLEFDQRLLQKFSIGTGKRIILAVGVIPDRADRIKDWPGFTTFFPNDEARRKDGAAWGREDMFLRCGGCNRVKYMNNNYALMNDGCCNGFCLKPLTAELEAARLARFEHGENG